MPIEGLTPVVISSTPMLAPVSDWGTRLIAPLGSSLMSKDGMIELAGRVYVIVVLFVAAVIVCAVKYRHLLGRVTPPNSSSTKEVSKENPIPLPRNSNADAKKKDEPSSFTPKHVHPVPSSTNPEVKHSSTLSGVVVGNANSTVDSMVASLSNPSNSITSEPTILIGNTPMPNDWLTNSLSIVDPLAKPTFEELRKTIVGDVEKIHGNFDLCSTKLQSCKPGSSEYQELIVDFKRKAGNFCKVYGPYEKAFDRNYFLTVKQYERILIELNDISRGIIRVKGDGNCLFHSFVEAFTRLNPYLVQFEFWDAQFTSHEYLRGVVNAYMQENLELDLTLKLLIDDAIIAHVEAKKSDIALQKESEQYKLDFAEQFKQEGFEIDEKAVRLKLEQLKEEESFLVDFEGPNKYKLYFDKFNEMGFFAAFAAAYAMCKILKDQIGIRIADEPKEKITTEYNAFNENAPILITLVFKGDHFDVKFPEGCLY